jgi:hypothetical protein
MCCSVPVLGWNRTATVATRFTSSNNQTAPNLQFFVQLPNFANSTLGIQLSMSELIISQYDACLKDVVFDALLPTALEIKIRSIFVESQRNAPNYWDRITKTQRILIGSQIGELEVNADAKYIFYICSIL